MESRRGGVGTGQSEQGQPTGQARLPAHAEQVLSAGMDSLLLLLLMPPATLELHSRGRFSSILPRRMVGRLGSAHDQPRHGDMSTHPCLGTCLTA